MKQRSPARWAQGIVFIISDSDVASPAAIPKDHVERQDGAFVILLSQPRVPRS